jgi:hypothetical protein
MHHELSDIIYDVLAIGPQNGQQTLVQHTLSCEAAVRFALGSARELANFEHVDVVLSHDDGRGVDEAAQRVEYNDVAQAVVVHTQAETAEVLEHTQHFAFERQMCHWQTTLRCCGLHGWSEFSSELPSVPL